MQRAMVFIDFENFNLAMRHYYKDILGEPNTAKLDFAKFPEQLVKQLPGDVFLVKTFLCAPKPDEFLIQDPKRKGTYNWINGLKNQKYFTVIEGEHVARPVSGFTYETMSITNPASFYVVEKGTDINLGAHVITKAFLNAYDTAVIVSGDSDYNPVLDILNTIGKTTVSVGVKGQSLSRIKPHSDNVIILDKIFFNQCLRP